MFSKKFGELNRSELSNLVSGTDWQVKGEYDSGGFNIFILHDSGRSNLSKYILNYEALLVERFGFKQYDLQACRDGALFVIGFCRQISIPNFGKDLAYNESIYGMLFKFDDKVDADAIREYLTALKAPPFSERE